jgi:1,2-diacylglycerol 3-alpha-glucosyltransferase
MKKNIRAGILFTSFGPYHVSRINALSRALYLHDATLIAFRLSRSSDTYGWTPATPDGVPVITLSSRKPSDFVGAIRVAISFWLAIRKGKINIVFLPSYSPLPNLFCLISAKLSRCRTVLMTESWKGTEHAPLITKLLKQFIVRSFDSALVGGSPQLDYLVSYGMSRAKIFKGYDVVDNDYYMTRSAEWRHETSLPIPGLPSRYFLSLGRLVEKKNLLLIIRAYSLLLCRMSDDGFNSVLDSPPSLVIVGDGPLRQILENEAISLGLVVRDGVDSLVGSGAPEVVFYPFQQVDITPLFYSKCMAFVLASTSEEWGLVVNEAMACGAPVVVSNRVGSHFDLVQDGVNGFIFSPNNCQQLAEILFRFLMDSELNRTMSRNCLAAIQSWSPQLFGESGIKAINAALSS